MEIDIKTGRYKVKPTQFDHIYVDGHTTVRGKTQQTSAHFYLWADGVWRLGTADQNDYQQKQNFHGHGGVTESFFKAAIADLGPAINEWARKNPSLISEAEAKYKLEGIRNREQELRKHAYAVEVLRKEIERIKAGEHLPSYCKEMRTWYEGPEVPKDFMPLPDED